MGAVLNTCPAGVGGALEAEGRDNRGALVGMAATLCGRAICKAVTVW